MTDLLGRHDVLLADLDGTLYAGPDADPGRGRGGARTRPTAGCAPPTSPTTPPGRRPRSPPTWPSWASRRPPTTSSPAPRPAPRCSPSSYPPGSPVLVVGTDALAAEVTGVGLTLTDRADGAVAVVQGHSPDTGWRLLAEATVALRAGAVWVACNLDPTLPTERGPLPGNGSMVAALRTATGREPQVAGKPAPALLRDAVRRTGARSALMIGDRLDTDVRGRAGRRAGHPAGAHRRLRRGRAARRAARAAPGLRRRRPRRAHPDRRRAGARARAPAGRSRSTRPAALTLAGAGDPLDALRALCAAHWADARRPGPGPSRRRRTPPARCARSASAATAPARLPWRLPTPRPGAPPMTVPHAGPTADARSTRRSGCSAPSRRSTAWPSARSPSTSAVFEDLHAALSDALAAPDRP